MTPEKPSAAEFLSPETLRLWSLPDGGVVLKAGGERHVLGPMKRALPLSEPERFIVLYDDDGQEIGTVREMSELDEESQTVLRAALHRAYHIERITRVLEVEREPLSGQTRWRVELAEDESETPIEGGEADIASTDESDTTEKNEATETTSHRFLTSAKPMMRRLLRRNTDEGEDPETPSHGVKTHEHEFLIGGQEDVSTARYPHIFIVDTERNRYEIPNCELLDPDSRRTAERYF